MTKEEAKSCICTIKMLQRLAYNIHGVMDVIDADNCKKIIKALEQEPCEDCVNRHTVLNTLFYKSDNNCEVVLNKELQDRIKALPSVTPIQRWIPVSERLPEEFADVFCSTNAGEVFIAAYLGKMNDGVDCFDNDNGMMWEGDVIAWMPLPEPYKAESEE